jgi:CRISPR-associated protein Cas2
MLYLVCYDIGNDRRRYQVAKLLKSYGLRVQKSVFECVLDDRQYEFLHKKLINYIKRQEDQLRFYPLPERSRQQVKILGMKPEFSVDDNAFIV